MFFSSIQIDQLQAEYDRIEPVYDGLVYTIITELNPKLTNQKSQEFLLHGFTRRLKTLKRCIENIYTLCPPSSETNRMDGCIKDIEINLQSFIFNTFGCLDNLAWVWVSEINLKGKDGEKIDKNQVGLMSRYKQVRRSFSKEMQIYLKSVKINNWCQYLINFRDSLAHRIPLYVPPYCLSYEEDEKQLSLNKEILEANKTMNYNHRATLIEEQNKLGTFIPIMTHSFSENSNHICFHSQILSDWNTIIEIAEKIFNEIKTWHQTNTQG
jgi:hypothetical protein